MSEAPEFDVPAWVASAFDTARELQESGNAYWRERLGDTGLFGGFQVTPGGPVGEIQFESVLFGGRSYRGSAEAVRGAQRAYVDSRRRKKPAHGTHGE